tara:strand:- start:231 stop:398 length:168 start_codon:yes stop_codon:yes gene_type:complete
LISSGSGGKIGFLGIRFRESEKCADKKAKGKVWFHGIGFAHGKITNKSQLSGSVV